MLLSSKKWNIKQTILNKNSLNNKFSNGITIKKASSFPGKRKDKLLIRIFFHNRVQ